MELREFPRDLLDPCGHGGALRRRQRSALDHEGIPLLPKLD
jgi:hypothetical protein